MFDRNLKFPIIGFGIGTTDSKGQLIEVHFTKIIDQGNELFNTFSKMLGKNDFVTDINKDEFMSSIDDNVEDKYMDQPIKGLYHKHLQIYH